MEQPCDKAPQDQARESLIAIAYSSPEESQISDVSPDNKDTTTTGASAANGDAAERLRSELISLSYIQSPDVAVSPLPDGVCRG